jgi:hypothetical protein
MKLPTLFLAAITLGGVPLLLRSDPPAFPEDSGQILERTSFQTSKGWSEQGNLRADVAMVYGIDRSLPERVKSWRDRGYRVHLMTGVSWGQYQDYLYGRFDGKNHEDHAPAILLFSSPKPPRSIQLDDQPLTSFTYDAAEGLLRLRFSNEARPRNLVVAF